MPDDIEILQFKDALADEVTTAKRYVLLGNGFSRAWRDDVFSYGALYENANVERLNDEARRAFEILQTTNFEAVMRALRTTAAVVQAYTPEQAALRERLLQDAGTLRDILVETLGRSHPSRPSDVSEEEYRHARAFLAHFDGYYTLNYDLLLYWALMQRELAPDVTGDDGFRTPDDGAQSYVTWEVENSNRQTVFYLHGALHVFDGGHEVQKYTWSNTQIALMDQIRDALDHELYPVYVADGDSRAKLAQIKHSDYLSRAYRSFAQIGGSLYVYGHSMDPGDEHVVRLIEKNKCKLLSVGLYGDPASPGNLAIRRRCQQLVGRRPAGRPLRLTYFDAASAQVWRD